MISEFDKKLIFKFLELNYPVSRIKIKHHFKRAIVLDDGSAYILSDSFQLAQLNLRLIQIIHKVLNYDTATSQAVLNNFLRLK